MAIRQQGQSEGQSEGQGIEVRGNRGQRGRGRGDLARSRIGRLWGGWPETPIGMMRRMFEDMDMMMGGSGAGAGMYPIGEGMHAGEWMPAIDLFERDNKLIMRAELPGCERSDIQLRVDDGMLIVEGERHMEHEEETREGYYQSERRYGRFQRAISLPSDIDEDKVKANFANGILEVIMPRSGAKQGRSIDIGEASTSKAKVKH